MYKTIACTLLYLCAVALLCYTSTGSLLVYLDLPALLFVVCVGMLNAIGITPSNSGKLSQIHAFGSGALSAGIVASLCGLVAVLSNLSAPEKLGLALSVAILGLFYGVVLKGLSQLLCRKQEP